MSLCLGSTTDESHVGSVIETTTAVTATSRPEGKNGGKREQIPGVIKVFVDDSEPQGRLHQKRDADAVVKLPRRTGKDAVLVSSVSSTGKRRTSDEQTRDANAGAGGGSRIDPSTIDLLGIATAKPEVAMPSDNRRNGDNDSVPANDPRQQQMVPFSGARNSRENESNGNSATDEADIPAGSSGNETMNAKAGIGTIAELGGNLRRRLLWISATSPADEDRGQRGKAIADDSAGAVGAFFSVSPRVDLNFRIADAHSQARHKRSTYSLGDVEPDDEVDAGEDAESVAIGKAAVTSDKKQEVNEEYPDQNAEELVGDYNDRGEGVIEGTIRRC